jgi:hypothetical protein
MRTLARLLDTRFMATQMPKTSLISRQLSHRSVVPMSSTIPPEMTIEQWRGRGSVELAACQHLHEATTRYDSVAKLLSFLLVCPVCGTERVIETQAYEPRFVPSAAAAHALRDAA